MAHDKLIMEGLEFYGYHGTLAAEQELGQRFILDIELALDLRRAGETDDLAATVNYAAVYRLAAEIVRRRSRKRWRRRFSGAFPWTRSRCG